jgi:chromosome segregation ATPase
MDADSLTDRLAAVERAVTDGEADTRDLASAAEASERLDAVDADVAALDDRLTDLEAEVQALRGYLGGVDAVDESVERRADAALAAVERLEAQLADDPALTVERLDHDPVEPVDDADGDDSTSLVERIRDAL